MIQNFMFQPMQLSVKPGTKVTWVNKDNVTHTASEAGGGGPINSGNIEPGHSYSVTLTKPGTYHYICDIHQYMRGTITVK